MPIYEYRCTSCGHTLEVIQKINDKPLKKCTECSEADLAVGIPAPRRWLVQRRVRRPGRLVIVVLVLVLVVLIVVVIRARAKTRQDRRDEAGGRQEGRRRRLRIRRLRLSLKRVGPKEKS